MRLRYLYKNQITDAGKTRFDEKWYDGWLQMMVDPNPDVIFFLITETTDVDAPEFI